jgi:hypothetical protein
MPVAYKVRPGSMPGCALCSLIVDGHPSLIAKPSWVRAPRTSAKALASIRAVREQEMGEVWAAKMAAGMEKTTARVQAMQEVWPKHPETGWEAWLLRGCEHAKPFVEWPTRDLQPIESAWGEKALQLLLTQASERMWGPLYTAKAALALGFTQAGETPPVMSCPKCADTLFADRVRPVLTLLADGRWQIVPSGGCCHIPDTEKSRADTAQELADRWNGWAAKKLEERLATADLADGVKGCFAAAVAAR